MNKRKLAEKYECDLLNLFLGLGELSWSGHSMQKVTTREKGDFKEIEQPWVTPVIKFRFKEEDPTVINQIHYALDSYQGDVDWIMHSRKRDHFPGTNHVIEPKHVLEVREKARAEGMYVHQYLAKYEPEFGPKAFDDLDGLTEHFKKIFNFE